ncbi:MAG: NAD(P)H-dependent flavin oxidoreductase [Candidatus Binataceae bacterium]
MLKTKLCELLGIEYPIISAGMGSVALAELAAAVSEAGGLGTIGAAGLSPEALHHEIVLARRYTQKPLAVNLLVPFLRPGVIETLANEPIQAVTFFWGEPEESLEHLMTSGIKIIWQCGSVSEARAAIRAGANAIMAQGFEAGGHVHGTVSTMVLVPEIRDAINSTPLIAAGGMADGRGLAAALALGADGAAFGTRFVASTEATAVMAYKQRILTSSAEDTICTTLYDVGWPDAPHRVLRTEAVVRWEQAGRPPSGHRPGEGMPVGVLKHNGLELASLKRYSVMPPTKYFEGDEEELAFYAGQSCSLVHEVMPAGEIVKEIARDATAIIRGRLTSVIG